MGLFERFLTVWVALAILAGVLLGRAAPDAVQLVAQLEVARINLVVAALIWVMIYPMMLAIEPRCIAAVGRRPRGLVLTLVVNWRSSRSPWPRSRRCSSAACSRASCPRPMRRSTSRG